MMGCVVAPARIGEAMLLENPEPKVELEEARPLPAAPGGESFLQLRVILPFIIVTLIWGSTWIVIRDQISTVPAVWSVAYRFVIATAAMFAYAAATGVSI